MKDDPLNRLKVKRGSELPWAKLDEDTVKEIRQIIEHREKLKQEASRLKNANLAKHYGVHQRTIDKISTGESWGHV